MSIKALQDYTFSAKYASEYKNSRNMISGLLNKKVATSALTDCTGKAHTYFNANTETSKLEQFAKLKKFGFDVVDFIDSNSFPKDLKGWEAMLANIKTKNFMADGIVIELSDAKNRTSFNSNGNPNFGIAYKVQTEDNTALTQITDIEWNISKLGVLVPRIKYVPVELNETTCTYTAGFNYKFIMDNKVGIGTTIKLQKSGDIIPYIVCVVDDKKNHTMNVPTECPSCGSDLKVSDTGVQLFCDNKNCYATKFNKAVSFFETLEIDGFGASLLEKIMEKHSTSDFTDVLYMTADDITMDGIGEKNANKIVNNIKERMEFAKNNPHILMNASGFFTGLGSRKLKVLVEAFGKNIMNTYFKVEDITAIAGFETTSAKAFITGLIEFKKWVIANKIWLTFPVKRDTSNLPLNGKSYVFTGFRDKVLQQQIEDLGGKVTDSVSKTTTVVVTADADSTSSKAVKAMKLGVKVVERAKFSI